MNLISLAIKRPMAVAMFALPAVCTGLAAFTRLPLDLNPDVCFPKLLVIIYWPDSIEDNWPELPFDFRRPIC